MQLKGYTTSDPYQHMCDSRCIVKTMAAVVAKKLPMIFEQLMFIRSNQNNEITTCIITVASLGDLIESALK